MHAPEAPFWTPSYAHGNPSFGAVPVQQHAAYMASNPPPPQPPIMQGHHQVVYHAAPAPPGTLYATYEGAPTSYYHQHYVPLHQPLHLAPTPPTAPHFFPSAATAAPPQQQFVVVPNHQHQQHHYAVLSAPTVPGGVMAPVALGFQPASSAAAHFHPPHAAQPVMFANVSTGSALHPTTSPHQARTSGGRSNQPLRFSERSRQKRCNKPIEVPEPAKGQSEPTQIQITKLAADITTPQLEALFSQYEGFVAARVVSDGATGFGRGYGFLWYDSQQTAMGCIAAAGGRVLLGKRIGLAFANPQIALADYSEQAPPPPTM